MASYVKKHVDFYEAGPIIYEKDLLKNMKMVVFSSTFYLQIECSELSVNLPNQNDKNIPTLRA